MLQLAINIENKSAADDRRVIVSLLSSIIVDIPTPK
jgi:hypothetical protein